jgi:hypothetical protein
VTTGIGISHPVVAGLDAERPVLDSRLTSACSACECLTTLLRASVTMKYTIDPLRAGTGVLALLSDA